MSPGPQGHHAEATGIFSGLLANKPQTLALPANRPTVSTYHLPKSALSPGWAAAGAKPELPCRTRHLRPQLSLSTALVSCVHCKRKGHLHFQRGVSWQFTIVTWEHSWEDLSELCSVARSRKTEEGG